MIIGIVLGMKYLHSKDIIHTNLKLSHLLIDANYRIAFELVTLEQQFLKIMEQLQWVLHNIWQYAIMF
jgi:serine/threonine protein kinase